MDTINASKLKWTEEENIAFGIYGTPTESLTHRFVKIDTKRFGEIPNITAKATIQMSFYIDA